MRNKIFIYYHDNYALMIQSFYICKLKNDNVISEILEYLILKGPATAYRIARDTNLYFSQVYRKISSLEEIGAVRRLRNQRCDIIEVTERGLVICLLLGCVPHDIVIRKLEKRYKVSGVLIKEFLDTYLDCLKNNAIIDEIPVMVFYALYKGVAIEEAKRLIPFMGKYVQPIISNLTIKAPGAQQ